MSKRGGTRAGAGRPQTHEPTRTLRVPESAYQQLTAYAERNRCSLTHAAGELIALGMQSERDSEPKGHWDTE